MHPDCEIWSPRTPTQEAPSLGPSGFSRAQERVRCKALAPQVKREAIGKMIQDHQLFARHTCRLIGLSRNSYRNPLQPDQLPCDSSERIVDIDHMRRRFGYRRIHDLLRSEFPQVNHRRVYWLYRDANLAVRRRKKSKRLLNERVPLQLAQTVNEV